MSNLTISDIAKKANVSKTTVSRVLNHPELVQIETRKKILQIIKEHNYSPSAVARSLSKSESEIIGLIVPQLNNPFFGDIMVGMKEILDQNNLTMICCSTDDDIEKDFISLETIKHHRVKGLLYTPANDYSDTKNWKRLISLLREIDTSVVLMDRKINGIDLDSVYFNDEKAVYLATKKLIEAGHKKIAIINDSPDKWSLARIRYAGFKQAHQEAGMDVDPRYVFTGKYEVNTAYELSMQMLSMSERPTAVVTCNNSMSIGFIKALYENNEQLGENIVCFGLDKVEPLNMMNTEFNYIKRDGFTMGKTAMELLVNRIAFTSTAKKEIVLPSELIIKNLSL